MPPTPNPDAPIHIPEEFRAKHDLPGEPGMPPCLPPTMEPAPGMETEPRPANPQRFGGMARIIGTLIVIALVALQSGMFMPDRGGELNEGILVVFRETQQRNMDILAEAPMLEGQALDARISAHEEASRRGIDLIRTMDASGVEDPEPFRAAAITLLEANLDCFRPLITEFAEQVKEIETEDDIPVLADGLHEKHCAALDAANDRFIAAQEDFAAANGATLTE